MLNVIAIILFIIGSLFFGGGIRAYMFPKVTTKGATANIFKSFIVGALFLCLLIAIYKGCNHQSNNPTLDYDGK